VREWAMRRGWGERLMRQKQAKGVLVAALGTLAAHSGYRLPEAVLAPPAGLPHLPRCASLWNDEAGFTLHVNRPRVGR